MFEAVTRLQRFVCESTMDHPMGGGPIATADLFDGLPIASTPFLRFALRGLLFETAARWARVQHQKLAGGACPCAIPAVTNMAWLWHDQAALPRDLFCFWIQEFTAQLLARHPPPLAHRAAALISAHAKEAFDLEMVARALGRSPSTIRRAMVETYGMPPKEYYVRVRVRRIERFIRAHPEAKLSPLAFDWGWLSPHNFFHTYKRVIGCTPGATRRKALAERQRN